MEKNKILPEGWQDRLHNIMKVLTVIAIIAAICWVAGLLQTDVPQHAK